MENYLKETKILDFSHENIQSLIEQKKWRKLDNVQKVKRIYNFVRDEILFGYNICDDIPASKILEDGYGQCNTKGTLLMALLRANGIPNRLHGFTINKALQKGAISGIWYRLSPNNILHTWVEVFVNEKWFTLEGVILDKPYLLELQRRNKECKTTFCGFGVFTDNFQKPQIDWDLNNTYIQDKGINNDFGLFNTPDELYLKHKQILKGLKKFVFENVVRHRMNKNVNKIRKVS